MSIKNVLYTTEIAASSKQPEHCPVDWFERETLKHNCYEVISDVKPVRLYFDIDYGRCIDEPEDDVAEYYEEDTDNIIEIAEKLLTQLIMHEFKIQPIFAVATSSSPRYVSCKDNKLHWKHSVHLVITNVVATKETQKGFIHHCNEHADKLTDYKDVMWNAEKLFDTSIYNVHGKLRCLNASKPGENRPLKLVKGTFNDMIVCHYPDDVFVMPEQKQQKTITYTNSIRICENVDINKMEIGLAINKGVELGIFKQMMKPENYMWWINIGTIIKQLTGDAGAYLFHKVSCTYKSYDKDETDKVYTGLCSTPLAAGKNPLTIASLYKYFKDTNIAHFTSIQEYVKAQLRVAKEKAEAEEEEEEIFVPTKPLEIAQYIIDSLPNHLLRKGKDLYMFSNHRWISGMDAECALASYIYKTVLPYLKQQVDIADQHVKKRQDALDKFIKINNSNGIINKVRELLPVCTISFDTNPYLLGFDNGIVDLKALCANGKAFRQAEPTDYISMSVGYEYKEEDEVKAAEAKKELDAFFTAVMPKEADHTLLMQTLASCLDGIGYEKLFMMNGDGGNGKSIAINLMSSVLGDYFHTAQNAVVKDIAKANESSSDVYDLKGKRMICFEELGNLDNNIMKKLTGGVKLTARKLYHENEHFYLMCTILGTFNQRPDIINTTGGNSDLRRYVDEGWFVNFTDKKELVGTTAIVKKQLITYQLANNKYSNSEWRNQVKFGMLLRLLEWYKKSFNTESNCIEFTVPKEAVNRVADFINDQNHFHRIFHEIYEIAPEDTTQHKLFDIWNGIKYHSTFICLPVKERKRFGRKAFDEWIEKAFPIHLDKSSVKYIVGITNR